MSVIRRIVVMFIGILIASVVTIVMPAPEAYAGNDCSYHFGFQLCGALKNRTGRVINFTTNLKEKRDKSAPHFCDVWNWEGGPGRKWLHAGCKQETSNIAGVLGGNGTSYDVDAFTFANHGYHVRHGRFGPGSLGVGSFGDWHWEVQGVWTKIRDGEIADCGIGDNNQVWCTLLFSTD